MHERPGFSHTFFRLMACRRHGSIPTCRSCHELTTHEIGKLSQLSIQAKKMCQGLINSFFKGQLANPYGLGWWVYPLSYGKNGEFRPQHICLYRVFSMTALACLDQFLQMFCRIWFVSMQPHIPSRRRNVVPKVWVWLSEVPRLRWYFVYRYPVIPLGFGGSKNLLMRRPWMSRV